MDQFYKIILFFLLVLFPLQLAATERSLLLFSHEKKEEIKSNVLQLEGKIMVEWPGGLWVRWSENSPEKIPEPISRYAATGIDHFAGWLSIEPQILKEPLQCDTEEVEGSLSRSSGGTSDSLIGHTVCALFFVNQINSENPWTEGDQQQIMQNTALNLAWWAEKALLYEKEVSFEIQPYYYNDPICQVSEDPTTSTGRSWAMEIMDALGYDRGSLNERQLDFTFDLIQETESDWGFIAYIIRGAEPYRSNAQIFGPSTTVHFSAARSSLVFAHEVGHIFGLRDEYEERAFGTLNWTLNDLENLNADYRNLINAPCIMKTASVPVGMCCYNAVHLAWTREVEEFTVVTNPHDAFFTVQYLNTTTNEVFQEREHQGHTVLPLGRGQKVRLVARDTIFPASGKYSNPIWSLNSMATLELTADGNISQAELSYQWVGESQNFVEYWQTGVQLPSRKVQALARDKSGGIFILTNQGIGYYKEGGLTIFDKEIEVRPGEFLTRYRAGHSITAAKKGENSFVIGGSNLSNLPMTLVVTDGEPQEFYEPPNEFRQEGYYNGAVLTEEEILLASFSSGGLHRYRPDRGFDILTTAEGLPDNQISSININPDGKILLGYDGGRTGMGFSGLFAMDTDSWIAVPYSGVPQNLRTARINAIKYFNDGEIMAVITRNGFFENENGQWTSHTIAAPLIFDVDRISENRWLVGTSAGLFFQDEAGEWKQRTREEHQFQENFIRSVLHTSDGFYLAGHQNYGLTLYSDGGVFSSSRQVQHNEYPLVIIPNPTDGSGFYIRGLNKSGKYALKVFDSAGRLVRGETVSQSEPPEDIYFESRLRSGIYHLKIYNATTVYKTKVAVKN